MKPSKYGQDPDVGPQPIPVQVPTQEPHHAGFIAPINQSLYCPPHERRRRDNGWTVAYVLLMAVVAVWGAVCIAQGGKEDEQAPLRTTSFYQYSQTCNPAAFKQSASKYPLPLRLSNPGGLAAPAPAGANSEAGTSEERYLAISAAVWVSVTILVGIPASLLYLHLFRKWPLQMTKATVYGVMALLVVFTLITLVLAFPMGIIMVIVCLFMAFMVWRVRPQLPLCAELLGVASRALMENLRVIPTTIAVSLVTLGVMIYLFVGMVQAANLGTVVKNPYAYPLFANGTSPDGEIGVCYNASGYQVDCCTWSVDNWPTAYIIIASIMLSWTVFTVMQVKLHIVADLFSQWYYKPVGAFSNDTSADPSLKVAVRNALTHGFGTAAFAGAILFLIATLRQMLRENAQKNWLACILNCLLQPVLALLQQFTQFASIAAAITGKAFVPAARDMFDALKRLLFKTDSVWWVPDLVIGMCVYVCALVWCALPFLATGAGSRNWAVAFGVAAFCFIIMVMILSLTAGILLDIVNTLYVCFALDRDAKVTTRPEVHQVYNQVIALTSPDAVIQNPDGDLAYGRAEEGRAPGPIGGPSYAPNPHERDNVPLMSGPPQPLYMAPTGQPYYAGSSAPIPAAPYSYTYASYPPQQPPQMQMAAYTASYPPPPYPGTSGPAPPKGGK